LQQIENLVLFEYRKSVAHTIIQRRKIMAKRVNLSLEEQIGFSAGEIYNYLHQNGTTSFAKMKKELDLKGNFADLGLGWLARENKVEIEQKGPAVKVSLR
jgi:hypothetical protein